MALRQLPVEADGCLGVGQNFESNGDDTAVGGEFPELFQARADDSKVLHGYIFPPLCEVVSQWLRMGALVTVAGDDGRLASVEAGPGSRMAGSAHLVHPDQKGIAVAVKGDRLHELDMPGSVALAPVFLARTGVESDTTGGHRAPKSFVIHPAQHEDLVGVMLLDDGGYKACRIALERAGNLLRQGCGGVARCLRGGSWAGGGLLRHQIKSSAFAGARFLRRFLCATAARSC